MSEQVKQVKDQSREREAGRLAWKAALPHISKVYEHILTPEQIITVGSGLFAAGFHDGYDEGHEIALAAANQWTRIEDGLPTTNGYYLISTNPPAGFRVATFVDDEWFDGATDDERTVYAWMAIPTLRREG